MEVQLEYLLLRSLKYKVDESFNRILNEEKNFLYKDRNITNYKYLVQKQKMDLIKN